MNNQPLRFFLAALSVCVTIGAVLQFFGTLGPDVSWINYGVTRILSGAKLYTDIVEINPPLIYYLSMPPFLLASFTGISGSVLFIIWVLLLGAISSLTCYWVLNPMRKDVTKPYVAMCLAQAALITLLIGESFGQREHFVFILLSPYVFLKIARVERRLVSAQLSMLIGIIAAAAIALKPHYFLVLIFLECFQLYRLKGALRSVFSPEIIVGSLAAFVMLGLLIKFYPEYLARIVPLGAKAYLPFYKESMWTILGLFGISALLVTAYVFAEKRAGLSVPGQVLAIAAAASAIAMLLQFRGFPYQLLATLFFLLISSAYWAFSVKPAKAPWIAFLGIIVLTFLLQLNSPLAYKATFPMPEFTAKGNSVAVFSTNIHDGFPFAPAQSLIWTSRFPSLWFIPFIDHVDHAVDVNIEVDKLDVNLASELRTQVVDDLITARPEVIMVKKFTYAMFVNPVNYLKILSKDPRFSVFFSTYQKDFERDGFIYYQRNSGK